MPLTGPRLHPQIGLLKGTLTMRNVTIVDAAVAGRSAKNNRWTFWTAPYKAQALSSYGWLNDRLLSILLKRSRTIRQVIYSYSTPVAWLDRGKWIVPDVSYSTTTSTKHVTHLWNLPNRVDIPADCGLDEYESYVSGASVYRHGKITAGALA